MENKPKKPDTLESLMLKLKMQKHLNEKDVAKLKNLRETRISIEDAKKESKEINLDERQEDGF